MKINYFAFHCIFFFAATTAFTQSQQNDLKLSLSGLPLIGSSENFSSGLNGFVLKPALGYFISDRTSLELNFTYAALDDLKTSGIDSHYTSYAFVPGLRYAAINNNKLRVFGEAGFGFGTIKYEPDNNQQQSSTFEQLSGGISVLSLGIGIDYYFSDSFGLEFILPYIHTRNITSNYVDKIYSGIGPTIGVTFTLPSTDKE